MKKIEFILPILALGILWGLAELLPMPTVAYIAVGILILTIGRVLLNRAGSSIIIGLVVCAVKALSASCIPCMWGGIMAVAVSYDLLATFFLKTASWSPLKSSFLGMGVAALAAPLFIVWVLWVVPEPYWAEGGLPRVMDYLWTRGVPATLISTLSAPLGFVLAGYLKRFRLATNPSRIQ
jgi:hypothetical protein